MALLDVLMQDSHIQATLLTMPVSLASLSSRCFPFLRHHSSVVRLATLRTLRTLLQLTSGDDKDSLVWLHEILKDFLSHLVQCMLLEPTLPVQEAIFLVRNFCVLL